MTGMREVLSAIGHELRILFTRRIWMGGPAGNSARGALGILLALVLIVSAGIAKLLGVGG